MNSNSNYCPEISEDSSPKNVFLPSVALSPTQKIWKYCDTHNAVPAYLLDFIEKETSCCIPSTWDVQIFDSVFVIQQCYMACYKYFAWPCNIEACKINWYCTVQKLYTIQRFFAIRHYSMFDRNFLPKRL